MIAGAFLWRLPLVIDFSDEAYYAIFIDGWLKALIIYLPVRICFAVTSSETGLILTLVLLRALLLVGLIAAALSLDPFCFY